MNGADQSRKKYLPNLTEHLACCSTIYQRMIHFLPPTYVVGETFQWKIADYANLEVDILEQHKYTDLVVVKYKWAVDSEWLTNLEAKLKLCHDMNLAEVVGFVSNDKSLNLLNRDHTNKKVSYPDEKRQIHHLLLEWLSLSLTS